MYILTIYIYIILILALRRSSYFCFRVNGRIFEDENADSISIIDHSPQVNWLLVPIYQYHSGNDSKGVVVATDIVQEVINILHVVFDTTSCKIYA